MKKSQKIHLGEIEYRLRTLTSIPAISGFESESKLPETIEGLLREYSPGVDYLGNVVAIAGSGRKKILVEAHLDEVGFIRTTQGFACIGSIVDKQIKKVNIITGEDGWLSYFKRRFEVDGPLVRSPALDNRTGCTALSFLPGLLQDANAKVYTAFTSREETTKEGILKVFEDIAPEAIISIDSAYAQPYNRNIRRQVPECGKGPAIQIQGRNFFINEYKLIEKVAKKENLPYQFEIVDSAEGGTNMGALVGKEVRRFQINIPVRYQHTNLSETDIRDIENTSLLVSALVKNICS